MARVYSSVRSCRIFRSSTQHSVPILLASLRRLATGLSQSAGGAAGAAYITDASFFRHVVQRVAGVVAEHVVERGAVAESGPQVGGPAGGADRAAVHERHPVAV